MRVSLLLITLAACGNSTVEGEIKAHKARLHAMLDTLDIALVRTDDQKTADAIDIDSIGRGGLMPVIPDQLRRERPLQILVRASKMDESTAAWRCRNLLTNAAFEEVLAGVTLQEVRPLLKECVKRYIEVVERDETAGRETYRSPNDGPIMSYLSKGGRFEIFDVADGKRVLSVRFPVRESPPASLELSSEVDKGRLYRAADEALDKLLTTAQSSPKL